MIELEEKKIYVATLSHREPPVFARKGQNGVAQAQAPGVEAITVSYTHLTLPTILLV